MSETPELTVQEIAPNNKSKFDILDMQDCEDGSCIMTVNMDYDSLLLFAKIGMMKVFEDAANRAIEDHGSTGCSTQQTDP